MHTLLILFLFSNPTLTWNDFQGTPDESRPMIAAETSAHLRLEEYDSNGIATYKVYPELIRNECWVRVKTEAVLKHETCHWQIFYIQAALCQKELAPYQNKKERPDGFIEAIVQKFSNKIDEINDKFDKESA